MTKTLHINTCVKQIVTSCGQCFGRAHFAGRVVRVLAQFGVHALQTDGVRHLPNGETRLVQDGDDAFVRLLHQVNDDLVVEVIDLQEGKENSSCMT